MPNSIDHSLDHIKDKHNTPDEFRTAFLALGSPAPTSISTEKKLPGNKSATVPPPPQQPSPPQQPRKALDPATILKIVTLFPLLYEAIINSPTYATSKAWLARHKSLATVVSYLAGLVTLGITLYTIWNSYHPDPNIEKITTVVASSTETESEKTNEKTVEKTDEKEPPPSPAKTPTTPKEGTSKEGTSKEGIDIPLDPTNTNNLAISIIQLRAEIAALKKKTTTLEAALANQPSPSDTKQPSAAYIKDIHDEVESLRTLVNTINARIAFVYGDTENLFDWSHAINAHLSNKPAPKSELSPNRTIDAILKRLDERIDTKTKKP